MSQSLGFAEARVDSLPWEAKKRRLLNARILEAAVRTPQPGITEAYRGQPAGLPAIAESYPGGAVSVTVNTLGPDLSSRWVGPDAVDRFEITRDVRGIFHQFAAGFLGGEAPTQPGSGWHPGRYRESFGPKPGGVSAVGTRGDFPPHSPGYRPRRVGYAVRPSILGPGWRNPQEEKDAAHRGLSCRRVHGYLPHRAWVRFIRAGEKVRAADDPDGRRLHTDDLDDDEEPAEPLTAQELRRHHFYADRRRVQIAERLSDQENDEELSRYYAFIFG